MENLRDLLKEFYPFARKRFGFDKNAKIIFLEDEDNASNPLGKTAFYNPGDYTVSVYVTGRHPKDILRSVSHELVHHTQNCRGEFTNTENMGGQGYAQKDEHLREMEREAYEQGNLCFRDWEDMRKNNLDTNYVNEDGNMSNKDLRNNRLNSHIMEKWGFSSKQEETEEQVKEENGYDDDYELSDLEADFPDIFKGSDVDAEASADAEKDAGDEFADKEEDELEEGTKVYVIATENCGEEATVLEMLDDATAKIQIGDKKLVIRQDYLEKIKLDEAAKPDFLDLDKDGDKEEPMKSAAEDAEEDEDEDVKEDVDRANVKKAIEYMFTHKQLLPALNKLHGKPVEVSQFLAFVANKLGINDFKELEHMRSYVKTAMNEEMEIGDPTIEMTPEVLDQITARGAVLNLADDGATATKQDDNVWEISGNSGDLKDGEVVMTRSVIRNLSSSMDETVEEISSCAGGAVEGAPMASKDDDEDELEEAGRPHSMRYGRKMSDLDADAKTRETDFLKKKEDEKEDEDDDEDEKLEESFSIKSAASNRNKLMAEQVMKAWFNK